MIIVNKLCVKCNNIHNYRMEEPTVVFVESPFAGTELDRNIEYARRAMWDSLQNHNEAPILSHLLYPQNPKAGIVCDSDPRTVGRELGLKAAKQLRAKADKVIFYIDYGLTPGMKEGMAHALQMGKAIEERQIGKNPL